MVRTLSDITWSVVTLALIGLVFGAVTVAEAQTSAAPKRTIIESLDDDSLPGASARSRPTTSDSSATEPSAYDFSVSRELLPPVSGVDDTQATAGWVTVIEARELKTGSLPSDHTPMRLWLVGLLIAVGSVIIFRRPLQAGMAHAFIGLKRPSVMSRVPFAKMMQRTTGLGAGVARHFKQEQEPKPKWDAETENASVQMTQLLTQIDGVVSRLKDGSPLRDVLNQELRLIHYRIEAATEAARLGHETAEKSAARFRGLVRELERVRRIADSAAASVIDPRDQLAHPQSPSEAYAMLGVNPDAPPQVLKKLVDALRVTWHPDHARNESDRLLREERIKRINGAWDLINPDARA